MEYEDLNDCKKTFLKLKVTTIISSHLPPIKNMQSSKINNEFSKTNTLIFSIKHMLTNSIHKIYAIKCLLL